ncbi:MAG: hypothetical protein HY547_08820 [Elusimicrobia bacterium]|nr:hypothetical protein [Elusimicrobiota bacterium]
MDQMDDEAPRRQLLDFSRWVLSWKELPPERDVMDRARLALLNDLLNHIRVLRRKLLDRNDG